MIIEKIKKFAEKYKGLFGYWIFIFIFFAIMTPFILLALPDFGLLIIGVWVVLVCFFNFGRFDVVVNDWFDDFGYSRGVLLNSIVSLAGGIFGYALVNYHSLTNVLLWQFGTGLFVIANVLMFVFDKKKYKTFNSFIGGECIAIFETTMLILNFLVITKFVMKIDWSKYLPIIIQWIGYIALIVLGVGLVAGILWLKWKAHTRTR